MNTVTVARSLPATLRQLSSAALAAIAFVAGAAHAQGVAGVDYAAGRILVGAKAGLSDAELAKSLAPHGGKARRIGRSDVHLVDLPPGRSEADLVAQLSRHPHFKFAELDRLVPLAAVSNDPYLGSEWHIAKIGATTAWDVAAGTGVTIAVVDSGIKGDHADLAANIVPGWNFFDNNSNTADVAGHGTMVAGAAAASVNNGLGVAGVAGGARIMPLRVSDATGYSLYSNIAKAITYAADNGVRVVNVSIDGAYKSASVISAGNYLKSKNGLLFASAGNSGVQDTTTAPTTALIAVSATDSADARAAFSTYGNFVALSAPGVGIYTTNSSGGYATAGGTSFSSPVAAAVAALMMSANPGASSAQIEKLLFSTATDLGTAGRDAVYGYGRVNADAAVRAAKSAPVADTTAPTATIGGLLGGSTLTGLVPVDVSTSDNVGVVRVDLRVNGAVVASSTVAPYAFVLDTTTLANGGATMTAVVYDAAGNAGTSAAVSVSISNLVTVKLDTIAPTVAISGVSNGATVASGNVGIVVSGSDNSGAAGLTQTLSIDGKVVASTSGTGTLSYNWNTRKVSAGVHTLTAVAKDAAGNTTKSSITINR